MNARNLLYIHEKNLSESLSLADSKLKTKNFLSGHGIPFAETYLMIRSQQELGNLSFQDLPDAFVIKPNHGSKGQGILVVKRRKNSKYFVAGQEWSIDEMRLHMIDILQGTFSLYGSHDSIVIEELLLPGKEFSRYCRYGLADIRMIVYNYVPITAMVRMPTTTSGGKANLAQGAIGLGLNVADGKVMSLYHHRKNYRRVFPQGYEFLQWTFVPFWDSILLYSAQIQMYTGLGYLALDWVITPNGPKLLEINARAGLEIQNVNLVPLEKRLRQVSDLVVQTPEKGVAIAKTLFSHDSQTGLVGRIILHLEQQATIPWFGTIILRVDPMRQKTGVSEDIFRNTKITHTCVVRPGVYLSYHPAEVIRSEKSVVILWKNDLRDVLIDPNGTHFTKDISSSQKWDPDIIELDKKIYEIGKKINISSILRPLNYSTELAAFLQAPYQYNPLFEYWFPQESKMQEYLKEIDMLRWKNDAIQARLNPFFQLFAEKLQELEYRIQLIWAYAREDIQGINQYNCALFGDFSSLLLSEASKRILHSPPLTKQKQEKLLGRILSLDEVMDRVRLYLKNANIEEMPLDISQTTLSRMAVAYKRNAVKINISAHAHIREYEIDALLAHELGTHLRRFLAWEKTGLFLFTYGTGYYLMDEEGFAIYNSLALLPEGYEKNAMFLNYHLLSQADTRSFAQTAALVQSFYPYDSIERVFAKTFRLKRGVIHTDRADGGATYQKDKIYLEGYKRVHEWITEWWDPSLLYFGKVKIADLPLISKI